MTTLSVTVCLLCYSTLEVGADPSAFYESGKGWRGASTPSFSFFAQSIKWSIIAWQG